MERSEARAARTLVTGTSWPASSSSADFTAACSRSSFSLAENTLDRAAKNWSWAALNRPHSSSSSLRPARPAAFQDRIRSRYAAAVGPQSVDAASASASTTSFSLRDLASSRSSSSPAK